MTHAVRATRVGAVLAFGGLTLVALWTVTFGATSGCEPGSVVETARLVLAPGRIGAERGCRLARPVVGGTASTLLGAVVGTAGLYHDRPKFE